MQGQCCVDFPAVGGYALQCNYTQTSKERTELELWILESKYAEIGADLDDVASGLLDVGQTENWKVESG